MTTRLSSRSALTSTRGDTLGDILERVLDKGVVIAGDIKVKLVDIELLTIQIRLVVCSVDKAKELGMDWWRREPAFVHPEDASPNPPLPEDPWSDFEARLARLESRNSVGST